MPARSKKQKSKTSSDKNYVQFSKKLISAVMIFWGVIRLWSVIALWLNPDSGTAMAAIVRGVDDIAMVNVLAYTGNSVSEKIALGYFQMRGKELSKEEKEDEETDIG
jgi:hypothetical protein